MLIPLLKELDGKLGPGKVGKVLADRGYDSKKNFRFLEKRRIKAAVRPRDNADPEAEQPSNRRNAVRYLRRSGYKKWRDRIKYGARWAVETFFSTFKRLYGEFFQATSPNGMLKELRMKIHFYNQMINQLPNNH
jgi:transposase